MERSVEVDTIMGGIALLVAQAVIVENPFYGEAEIKRFLQLRRAYHEQFVLACAKLADDIEAGLYGTGLIPAAVGLRAVSRLNARQDRQALVQVVRILRSFRHLRWEDTTPLAMRLIRQTYGILEEADAPKQYGNDYTEFFKNAIRLDVMPAPLKTLLRKVVQLGKGSGKSITLNPYEDVDPGAWFDMTPEQQAEIRQRVLTLDANYGERFEDKPHEERLAIWKQTGEELARIQRQVGVNLKLVKSEREVEEPLEAVLKRESKMDVDGGTLFIMQSVIETFESSARYQMQRYLPPSKKPRNIEKMPLPRDAGKFVTLLRKARTLDTARRIIKEAVDRNLVGASLLEDLKTTFAKLEGNKAIREGIPLVPLKFSPTTKEAFQAAHDTGEVELPSDMSPEDQAELLGRVSRALDDIEGIFGKGFCGKHGKKLAFRFGGAAGFMAKAHYFAWDDREAYSRQKIWQPRITFGDDYEGVIAHELSHYFEDLIAFRIAKKRRAEKGEPGDPPYGGPGDIFGRSTAEHFAKASAEGKWYGDLQEILPQAIELMQTVVATPDYKRWCDKLGSSYETALPMAVKALTGQDMYDLPKDHPYAKAYDARYKSELPPELIAEAEKQYAKLTDGDVRKLSYYQSASEVWARMCEQYVYTKLSRSGVVNPWLTWLTYDDDVYVEQERYETTIEPIFDRLFAQLGARNLIAGLLRRWQGR